MANGINGHGPPAPDPARDVAHYVYTQGFEDGDTPWAELSDDEREALIGFAHDHLNAHLRWLAASGFRVVPPGSVVTPTTDDEAMAMVKAAKGYFDAKKRKGQLVASGPRPMLIVPGKLN